MPKLEVIFTETPDDQEFPIYCVIATRDLVLTLGTFRTKKRAKKWARNVVSELALGLRFKVPDDLNPLLEKIVGRYPDDFES